jgi:hypothetical protein
VTSRLLDEQNIVFMAKAEKETRVTDERILTKIYFIRGQKVMLDRDLAELYGVEPRELNQAVKIPF